MVVDLRGARVVRRIQHLSFEVTARRLARAG